MPYTATDTPSYVPKSKRRQWAAVWNSVYEREKKDGKSDKDAESSAFAQANGVAGPNAHKKYLKLMRKSLADDAENFANAVIEAMREDFANVPAKVRGPLETSMQSGVAQGFLQININDAALLSSANYTAGEYASERAAELVGMRRGEEGIFVENPDARWAISDTTREKIREIVTEAFASEGSIEETAAEIREALREEATGSGIFSEARAKKIAETEIMRAQVAGNFDVWQKSGVVKKVKWLTSEDEKVCEVCDGNDGVEREIGKTFPSGDVMPGAHPLCRCVLVVSEVV